MKPSSVHIVARVAAGLLGSYAFAWGFTTLGIALLLILGAPYGEAQTLIFLFAFPVLLIAFCWAFAAAGLIRVWVVLAGGGMLMTGVAWLLTRNPVSA